MPLTAFVQTLSNLNSTKYTAKGSKEETVLVDVSHEAMQDQEVARVQQKASDKYDAGIIDEGQVTVRTSDFG
jgi:hypothetical protein